MLFFRSEARIAEWCLNRSLPRGPSVSMAQLWGLAVAWYADRLDPAARRPQPAEMRGIFARLGLTGDFWDPQADTFGGPPPA
jgi:hypothetical protein